jgi:hypothetical protein
MIEPNTTTGSDELDRDKLAKVLGMLASPHDGESLAAGRAADALVRAVGATWETVLSDSGIAEEACRVLLTENVELRFENENFTAGSKRCFAKRTAHPWAALRSRS